jgi:Fe-S-cluster containining protein
MANNNELASAISNMHEEVSQVFSALQESSGLSCPPGCGACCMNPEISCSPFELLPLALHLLEQKRAEVVLEKAKNAINDRCIMLQVNDEEKGLGRCSDYAYRPFLCRVFGVSARLEKNQSVTYSICKVLKESSKVPGKALQLESMKDTAPIIEIWKRRFESLHPHLNAIELPINEALVVMIEKLLFWESYK